MGATHVTVRITNPAAPDRFWEGLFLVDTGATDSLVPKPRLEAIGLKPEGKRVYELADGNQVAVDITVAEIEFMGEIVGGTIVMGADDAEPLLGLTALASVGIEADPLTQRLKRRPGRAAQGGGVTAMNEAWAWRPLGELFEIGAGKTMSAAARNGADKTPFLRTSNVLWDEIDLSSVDAMSIPEHESQAKLLRAGDLLVCEGGEIGRAAIWNGEVETMSFQNHLHRLRPIIEKVEPRFYVYFLQSAFTQLGIFEGTGNRTTIPNLSRSRLAGLEVPQPKIGEQRAIVAALSRVREAIRTQMQSIEVAQDLKRAAMRTLFTRGLRDEAQKETEAGLIPESWEVMPFDKVLLLRRGFDLPLSKRREGSIPVFGSNGMVGHHDRQPAAIPVPGVMVGRSGSVGKVSFTANAYWPLNTTLFVENFMGNDQQFIAYFLGHFDFSRFQAGVSVPTLNRNSFAGVKVAIPPVGQQREIAAILDAIDSKIDLHRRKRNALDDLFKALLHKLMVGEIRVADLDLSKLNGTQENIDTNETCA